MKKKRTTSPAIKKHYAKVKKTATLLETLLNQISKLISKEKDKDGMTPKTKTSKKRKVATTSATKSAKKSPVKTVKKSKTIAKRSSKKQKV